MPRLDKTLADYIAIAISPALIMLMVGSLMWFLVAVFYQGSYDGRIYWILACYVFAIVLITRIAIEEGQERAAMFGVALAAAVGLATMRFSSSMYFHWILLALAWWAAHKLTMDCTLIDEEQDSSGQGLLQVIGLRKKAPDPDEENGEAASERKKEEESAEPEGVTQRVERMREEAHPKRRTKGKAHAPGVWIVYFSLAALPLFGLGQMLVPVADSSRRLWTFQLLCTYVAAGLGLLVTTSFVGLRRYLRQRGVQMPPQMAGVWIALGAAIIVALLAVCAILPRPAAEYQAARMPDFPLKFTTPERESNRHALGEEGADKNDPDSQSRTQGEQDGNRPEGGKSENPESGGEKGSNAKEGDGKKKSSDGKPQGSSKGEKQQQSESKQESSQSQDDSSQQSRQDSQSGDQSDQQQGDSRQQRDEKSEFRQERSDKQQKNGDKERSSDSQQRRDDDPDSANESNESKTDESGDPESEEKSPSDRRKKDQKSDSRDRSEQSSDDRKSSQDRRQSREEQEEEERSERTGSQSPSNQPPKPDKPPFQLPQVNLTGGLFGILKFLVYVVLACLGAWWLWKNWSRVVGGFRLFLQELRDLWARLFGGKPKGAETATEEEKPKARPERPFTDYVDPFAAGLAARYAPDELVRYTFEATEAWARENGCPRHLDQTPHEFAARLGRQVDSLRPGAVALARLYSQAAYAPGSLGAAGLEPLADFWRRLRASHLAAVQPPPVQTPVG